MSNTCDVNSLGVVKDVRAMTQAEVWAACGVEDESMAWAAWDTTPLVIEFTSGAMIYVMSDMDGNDGGTFGITDAQGLLLAPDALVKETLEGVSERFHKAKLKFSIPATVFTTGVFVLVMPDGQAYYI